MIAMTVRSFLRNSSKPIAFVPVYVGYEKIIEARSYLGELKGKKKKKENVFTLFKSLKKLRSSFGQVNVNFGQPFQLSETLNNIKSDWQSENYTIDSRPAWLTEAVNQLSEKVAIGINNAAAINPVNIVATILLTTPRLAMDERLLAEHCDRVISLLAQNPYSDQMTFPKDQGQEWIAYAEKMRVATRQQQTLGDIISLEGTSAILLTYYRNNILHLLAMPSLVASMCQNNSRMSRQKIIWLVKTIYPYIKSELYLRWEKEDIVPVIDSWIETLCKNGLLIKGKDALHRPIAGSRDAVLLHALARVIIPTLERYYIAIAILRRNGSDHITTTELESSSTQMAERMSILHGLNAPEFFDKTLFRNFINNLRKERIIEVNDEGKITYGPNMDRIGEDARLVLNAELRQSILQVAIDTEEVKTSAAGSKAA
jgi:glycerol-3-phosphate O-acyltransferase